MMESDRLSARKSTLEDHIRSRTKASRETIKDKFHWTSEAAKALEDLKHRLQIPPILTAPSPGPSASRTTFDVGAGHRMSRQLSL